ncbi:MAG TPA: ComEC/Rec2 family competence protein, partial [Burkholderiaceae bacterium]|nr:ComEC/Rec2 family competence protein [Burkholderiaceae bacterium]
MSGDEYGAAWRALGIGSWVAGIALLHRQAALPATALLATAAGGALASALVARAAGWRTPAGRALLAGAALLAGFSYAGWRASERLADCLAPAWEDQDIEVVGVVDEMPQVREDGLQFAFAVESASAAGDALASVVPGRVRLSWMRAQRDDRSVVTGAPALHAGERWSLPVRLRRPHGVLNPDGFDAELWLFEQGLRATGTVHGDGTRLGETWAPIERARQWGRDRLLLDGLEPGVAGTLAALVVGDQSAIAAADWDTYRDTGVAHLMSISGMHITMLGWLGARLLAAAWRRSERALLWLPAPVVGRWSGVAVACGYSLFAGWGVPAQRTVWMLGGVCLLRGSGVDWPAPLLALVAMLPVTLLDPWAVLQPGFWLSFAAVAWLMVSRPVRAVDPAPPAAAVTLFARAVAKLRHHVREGLRAQVIATVGLAPLALVAFQQLSLVGLLANLVAEPWVTLVVVPLGLAGLVFPPAWSLAAAALVPLQHVLGLLAGWPGASLHVAAAPGWLMAAGLAGGIVGMLPLPWGLRLLGLPLVLPLLAPGVPRPPFGRFEMLAVDVGQGSAIFVRTRAHLLVFDTGPRFGEA